MFAVGSTALLVITGALLYLGFNSQLDQAIDQALRDRVADIASDLRDGNVAIRRDEPYAALLDMRGQVLDTTTAHRSPVLSARELERAQDGEVVLNRRHFAGLGGRGRLLASPEPTADGRTLIVVVGESLDTVVRARQRLGLLLGAASPILIAVIGWCGWVLAGAALRPVERMTVEADAISLRESGQRLRQPPGDDEIAHLGRTLNAMLDRIEASIAHERAFVDDASHELRTPVSILRGELELAATHPGDRAGLRKALASALQESERLARLTDDLLVLARADRGRIDPHAEPVDLGAAARAAIGRHRLPGSPTLDVAGDGVSVTADPLLVDRILDNLIENSSRHAASQVRVEVAADGRSGRLTVADDGPGFPPEFLPTAFDRFSRADAHRGRGDGGSGLGLAIVASIVEGHGGRVAAGNGKPLGGGRVDVWLPLAEGR